MRRKNMFKGILAMIIVLIAMLISPMAMAYEEISQESTVITIGGDTVEPQAEETVWYKAYDELGRLWIRQWSLTRGIWLTDWILVG